MGLIETRSEYVELCDCARVCTVKQENASRGVESYYLELV